MWWHDRAQLAIDGAYGEKYANGLLSDITHVKELEVYLHQSQKMEAIGQLAGGIAHDFNNLLQVITGYAELVESCIEQGSRARQHMAKIKGAADRAKSLTEQLLGFSWKQLQQLTVLNLNEAVSQFEPILRRTLGAKVELVLRLSVAPAWIMGDHVQIQQILVNTALNARDAMPDGGDLVVETGHIAINEAYMGKHTKLASGDYVLLSITDTGTGMDAQALSHIFEPFFTTKAKGAGRGLGLATVYGIVKQTGGEILVNSEPGPGTCFRS
jgi:signal transduction histidine kinase